MRKAIKHKQAAQSRIGARGAILLVASLMVSAFLLSVSIGSPSHGWLGWLTLPPLFLAIRYVAPAGAAVCGGVWGASLFVFSSTIIDTPINASVGSLALLLLVPAAYAGLGSWLTRTRIGFSPLILAAAWIGVEYALAPLSMRFGLLAGVQARGSFLHAASGLLGYAFVAFVIAYLNGLFLAAVTGLRFQIPQFTRSQSKVAPRGRVVDHYVPLPVRVASDTRQARAPPLQ